MNEMNEKVFPIASFGTRLGTRAEGAVARDRLLAVLAGLKEPGRLIVSLDGVEVMSGSFADEAIALPYARLTTGEYGDCYIVVRAPGEEVVEDLAHKLERRRLAALCLIDGDWTVLGLLPPVMRDTLALVIASGTTTAREIAAVLNIHLNTCVNRVARLAALHLIRREQIGVVGPYPSYRLHSILPG